jgi:hypothetical protein
MKQCGKVREVKITELPNVLVATVEFFERVCFYISGHAVAQYICFIGQYTLCSNQRQKASAQPGGRSPSCMEIDALCDKLPRISR